MRVKDGRKQPFSWFPNALMHDYGADIGPHAGWVYMALVTHANKAADCWPAHDTLAAMTGMSVAQVKVSLNRLERLGLIAITMRRPKTNIYTVLDVPERPDNSQEVAITPDTPNSHHVAINSQDVAINSQDVAIEQPGPSYELDVLEPDPPNQNHSTTSPTPPPPTLSAPCLTTAAAAEVAPFDEVWKAYPKHHDIDGARQAWVALHPDATLHAAILDALAWQRTIEGGRFLPKYLAVYLKDQRWLDAQPLSRLPTPQVMGVGAELPLCKEMDCESAIGVLSDRRCDQHAMIRISEEATGLLAVLRRYSYVGADMDERDRLITAEVDHNHVNGSADRISQAVLRAWEAKGPDLTAEHLAHDVIAPALRDYRAPQKLAVLN
jgi:hypothetical protein